MLSSFSCLQHYRTIGQSVGKYAQDRNICFINRLSSQSRLTSRLAVNTWQSKGIRVSLLFILPLFWFNITCLFLECLGFILLLRGERSSTLHILFHSAHCSFHRWLISCLNSHQTQHAINVSINSPELMNTIAAFLNKKNPHIRAYLLRPGESWNMGSKQLYFSLIIRIHFTFWNVTNGEDIVKTSPLDGFCNTAIVTKKKSYEMNV